MAKPSETQSEPAAQSTGKNPAGGKKKGKLVIAIVAGSLLAAGGGGGWFFLSHRSSDHAAQAKPLHHSPPVFVTLEPFVVNLSGDVQHFLQVGIDLKVADANVSDQVKAHLPEVRNGVLLLLSSKKVEELSSLDGKNQLRDEIRAAVNRPLGIQSTMPAAAPAPVAKAPPGDVAQAGDAVQPGDAHAAAPSHSSAARTSIEPDEGVTEVLLTSFVIQ
jgi:flagellar FliL protein